MHQLKPALETGIRQGASRQAQRALKLRADIEPALILAPIPDTLLGAGQRQGAAAAVFEEPAGDYAGVESVLGDGKCDHEIDQNQPGGKSGAGHVMGDDAKRGEKRQEAPQTDQQPGRQGDLGADDASARQERHDHQTAQPCPKQRDARQSSALTGSW